MLHLIWYIIVGLIAGFVAKTVLHMHITLLFTIILGLIGSILGGLLTLGAVVAGNWIPGSSLEPFFSLTKNQTVRSVAMKNCIEIIHDGLVFHLHAGVSD